MAPEYFNPLDYGNLTRLLVRELMEQPVSPLPPAESFPGPGVYAIFYDGPFELYKEVCSPEASIPIYVGKAVPGGSRKGSSDDASINPDEPRLYSRLKEHGKSIDFARNLDITDFKCRYLTVVPLWIIMAERFLIDHYRPIWNVCLDGFGLHNPGKGRFAGMLPYWDTLHPGRPWAEKLTNRRPLLVVKDHLRNHLAGSEEDEK